MRRLVVELTTRCNLCCRHCLLAETEARRDLPIELVEKLLAEARPEGFDVAAFTGGEALLHPQFKQAVGLAGRWGYRFGVVTNGWGFPGVAAALDRYREWLEVVTFSLDGSTESSHDWLRGEGSFRRLMAAMGVCVVLRLPFTVNTAITRQNQHELEGIADLAAELGSKGIRFGHLAPGTTAGELELALTERRVIEARIRLIGGRSRIPVALAPGCATTDLFPCGALRGEEVSVDCEGNLIWCCQLPAGGNRWVAGNLREAHFADLLRRWTRRRERFREVKIERLRAGRMKDPDFLPCSYCAEFWKGNVHADCNQCAETPS